MIDKIGLDTRSYVDLYRTAHSEKLHLVERWSMTEDGHELLVLFTVEDEDTFHAPWSGYQRYRHVHRELAEMPCAQNNRFTEVAGPPVPVATKSDF